MSIRALALFSFFIIAFIATPMLAYAHGALFFEFAPDISSPHQTAYFDTPIQRLKPVNDFLGGFDIWLANSGPPGSATFQLKTESGVSLATKTVTIPTVAPTYGGTKFHVDFPSQPALSSGTMHHLTILSDIPNLILYESSQFQILQHNTVNYPYYTIQSALLGTVAANFAFKFALYELQENAPPVIQSASSTNIGPWGTSVGFTANEPVDYSISYAPSESSATIVPYTNSFTICNDLAAPCTVNLVVNPNTWYQYTIFAKDSWGNVGTYIGSFISDMVPVPPGEPSPPPATPPSSPTPPTPSPTPTPPPVTPPPTPPPPVTPPTLPPATPPPATTTTSQTPPPSGASGGNGLPVPTPENPIVATTIFDENGKAALIISWLKPTQGPPPDSYRVQIFDEADDLVAEFEVAGDVTTIKIVERLSQGRYRIRIFAERNGVRTPVGAPIDIIISSTYAQLPPFDLKRLYFVLGLLGLLGTVGSLGLITMMRRARVRKSTKDEKRGAQRGFNLGK